MILALLLPLPSCASYGSLFEEHTEEISEETQSYDTASTIVFSQSRYIFTGDTNAISPAGSSFYIIKGGTYKISGKLTDGNIIIDAEGECVRLVFCNLEIYCDSLTPIQVNNASEVIIETEAETKNTLECLDKSKTAILSQAALTIVNNGTLSVNGLALYENKT